MGGWSRQSDSGDYRALAERFGFKCRLLDESVALVWCEAYEKPIPNNATHASKGAWWKYPTPTLWTGHRLVLPIRCILWARQSIIWDCSALFKSPRLPRIICYSDFYAGNNGGSEPQGRRPAHELPVHKPDPGGSGSELSKRAQSLNFSASVSYAYHDYNHNQCWVIA